MAHLDPRQMAMVQSPTAQREQMAMQQTFANVQFASNLVMSNVLIEDKTDSGVALREAAKQVLITYFANLQQETNAAA